LIDLANIQAAMYRADDSLRSATRGLERLRATGRTAAATEGILPGQLGYAYFMKGGAAEAERVFAQALQKYTDLGLERGEQAMTIMNGWAAMMIGAGAPRRALQLFEQVERIESEREAGAEPSATAVGNRALALTALGRFEQARAAHELECRLAAQRNDYYSEVHCLIGLASVMVSTHS
jgi:tetratricopeptide (TPR) repeat protein